MSVLTFDTRYSYDPFGRLLTQNGSLAEANAYRFSSEEWHANAGLYYYGYRFYSPELQRWPNRDPLGDQGFLLVQPPFCNLAPFIPVAEQLEGPNLFSFIHNDSLNKKDTLGTFTIPFIPFPCPIPFQRYCVEACALQGMVPLPSCSFRRIGPDWYIDMNCGCWIPPWCPW